MPELPEVESARKFVEQHCEGLEIIAATVADDDKVIEDIQPRDLEAALKGRKLVKSQRKGKHMWLEFDKGPALMLHFGMTGSVAIKGQHAVKYVGDKGKDVHDWPPRFWKVQLDFRDDVHMAFCDARRFARVRFMEDPAGCDPVASLGFDVLAGVPSAEDLAPMLAKRRVAIKNVLLDQAFSAGVGNWVADEILHYARIHPEQRAADLSEQQVGALREAMVAVPRIAVDVDADSSRFPEDWIFHHRWSEKKAPSHYSFIKIGGRTTAFEPALQKLEGGKPATAKAAQRDPEAPQKPKKAASKKARRPDASAQLAAAAGEAMAREDSCAEVAEEDEEEVEPAPKRKRASVGAKQIHTEPASRRTKASADAKTTNGAGTEAATAPKKRSKATSAGKSKAGKSSARTRGASK